MSCWALRYSKIMKIKVSTMDSFLDVVFTPSRMCLVIKSAGRVSR